MVKGKNEIIEGTNHSACPATIITVDRFFCLIKILDYLTSDGFYVNGDRRCDLTTKRLVAVLR